MVVKPCHPLAGSGRGPLTAVHAHRCLADAVAGTSRAATLQNNGLGDHLPARGTRSWPGYHECDRRPHRDRQSQL